MNSHNLTSWSSTFTQVGTLVNDLTFCLVWSKCSLFVRNVVLLEIVFLAYCRFDHPTQCLKKWNCDKNITFQESWTMKLPWLELCLKVDVVCTHFKVNGINIFQGNKFELWCHKLVPSWPCTLYSIGIHVLWFITQIWWPMHTFITFTFGEMLWKYVANLA